MIKKHEINTAIGHPALTDLEGYLYEAISVTDQLVELLQSIHEFEGTLDDDDLLDAIDTAAVIQINGLHIFESCRLSVCSPINKYLSRTLSLMEDLLKLLEKYSISSMTPVDDDGDDGLNMFKKMVQQCIGGLAHFICYEFFLFEYSDATAEENEKPDIDEVYYNVTSKSGRIDAREKAVELCALAIQFKQRLDIFDEYPEKEIEFDRIMGPFAVELNENALTIELITDVIDGKLTPQELLAITNPDSEEQDAISVMNSFGK